MRDHELHELHELHDLDDVAAEFGIELADDDEVARIAAANAVRWAGVLSILAEH